MSKKDELAKIIKDNPEHELFFFYPSEGVYADYPYAVGIATKTITDKYWQDDERFWLKYNDECELLEHYSEHIYDELFPDVTDITDEQEELVELKTYEFINKQDWKKCICVYISH